MRMVRILIAFVSGIIGLLVIAPFIIVGFPFWLVVILTRAFAEKLEPGYLPWNDLVEFDSNVGWRTKTNIDAHALTDDVFHIKTDALGMPGKSNFENSDIVVVGDSFAWGYGVDSNKIYSELNQELNIKPLGAPGYDMVQGLILMRQFTEHIRDKIVAWFIYCGNDLYDNLFPYYEQYRKPFVRFSSDKGDWEITTSHITKEKWTLRSNGRAHIPKSELAAIHSQTWLSERVYSACDYLIKNAAELCCDVATRFVILTIPTYITLTNSGLKLLSEQGSDSNTIDPQLPDKKIGAICNKYGVEFVAAGNFLSRHHYKKHDEHWNERGHKEIAKLLKQIYNHDLPLGSLKHMRA